MVIEIYGDESSNVETMIKQFKKAVNKQGLLKLMKKRAFFVSEQEKRRESRRRNERLRKRNKQQKAQRGK